MCVLIVEDDQTLGRVFVRQLAKLGFKADLVTTGADAISRCGQECYGLVLMDIGLPDQDGISVTRQIREKHGHLPVVAVTAGHASREECLQAGMVDFFTKPLLAEHILSILNRWPPGRCPVE